MFVEKMLILTKFGFFLTLPPFIIQLFSPSSEQILVMISAVFSLCPKQCNTKILWDDLEFHLLEGTHPFAAEKLALFKSIDVSIDVSIECAAPPIQA